MPDAGRDCTNVVTSFIFNVELMKATLLVPFNILLKKFLSYK